MTRIITKRGTAAWLLLAAAITAFTGCDKILPGDTGTMGIITEILGVKLTINGVSPGNAYSVTAYAYPGGEIADYNGWAAATDSANKAGAGQVNAAGSAASVRLKGVGGIGAFKQGGFFLAVVTEAPKAGGPSVTKYKSGVSFGAGGVSLDWANMPLPPPITYTVSFETLGGSYVHSQTVSEDTTAARPASPTKTGHAFAGWYTDWTLSAVYDFNTPVNGDLTLYAGWIAAKTYTVNFDSRGGSGVPPQDIPEGELALLPSEPPTRVGHTFNGWYSDESLKAAYNFETPVTSGLTLYANWTVNTYTVRFDTQGGSEVPSQSVRYGGMAARPERAPLKEESAFDGWYLGSKDGLTIAYDFDTPVTSGTTLYAKWQLNTYTVTFDAKGGSDVPPQSVTYGDSASPPVTVKQGFSFTGWYSDEGATTSYDFGMPVRGQITLYAGWTINSYTVSFNTLGGSAVESQTLKYGEKASLPKAPPTRLGYIFGGWYTEREGGELYDFKNAEVSGDITLHAKWEGFTIARILADAVINRGSANKFYALSETEKELNGIMTLEVPRPEPVIIDGNGRKVKGDGTNRLTVKSGVTLILKNITLTAFPITVESDGALVLDKGAVITGNSGTGVTVGERGTLEMKDGALISENKYSGVRVQANGTFTMSGGAISRNSMTVSPGGDEYGGGVTVIGAGAVFTMTGGEITYNRVITGIPVSGSAVADSAPATEVGSAAVGEPATEGAAAEEAVVTVTGGEIADNSAVGSDLKGAGGTGGGVSVAGSGAVFTMTGGRIANNSAEFGGGVSVEGGGAVFTMTGGEIADNGAGSGGGGVFLSYSASFNMRGGTIRKNSAEYSGGGVYAWDSASFDMTGGVIGGDAESDANNADNGGGVCVSLATMTGSPQIGSDLAGQGKGVIKNNSPHNVRIYNDAGYNTYP